MQAPISPWLSPATLRNLADKLYEKRKSAALEVEQARRGSAAGACVRALTTHDLLTSQATKALAAAGDLISVVRARCRLRRLGVCTRARLVTGVCARVLCVCAGCADRPAR